MSVFDALSSILVVLRPPILRVNCSWYNYSTWTDSSGLFQVRIESVLVGCNIESSEFLSPYSLYSKKIFPLPVLTVTFVLNNFPTSFSPIYGTGEGTRCEGRMVSDLETRDLYYFIKVVKVTLSSVLNAVYFCTFNLRSNLVVGRR